MKIFVASIEIICGEHSFGNNLLFVTKNIREAQGKAENYIKEENSLYPGETFYKLKGVEEFNFLDGYKIKVV